VQLGTNKEISIMDFSNQQWGKYLIFIGLALVVLGLVFLLLPKFPIGKLPGDIAIKREGFSFYFPLTTSILASLLLTLIMWLFRKFAN